MAHPLNKSVFLASFLLFLVSAAFSQQEEELTPVYKDYKDNEQFYKFHRRSKTISAWQINELKEGCLVVRLKTNKTLIDALKAGDNTRLARDKEAETFIMNKNTMKAYINNFRFCKLYFMYSSNSDTLLKGARSGIFLDTNLMVDPSITMTEKFYLIAERDYVYNSSIGFVREDSARLAKEAGSPVREMGAVIKNKYGHQLKSPFPYYVKDRTFADYGIPVIVQPILDGKAFVWVPEDDSNAVKELRKKYPNSQDFFRIKVKKQNAYKNLSATVEQLESSFNEYFRYSPRPEENKLNPLVKPYLY